MLIPQPIYRTPSFWRRAIPAALFVLWLLFFSKEIGLVLDFLLNGATFPALGVPEVEYRYAILTVVISFLAFIVYLFASILFVSQFVLPVRQSKERRQVFDRLMLYFSGGHGPAVFIREGTEVANLAELQSSLPGVAFVDMNSAIVLERQPFASRSDGQTQDRQKNKGVSTAISDVRQAIEGPEPAQQNSNALARAVGPGIVFTRRGERIRGVVSLRNHLMLSLKVLATTRDGFQVQGNVVTIFSLGLPPDVVRIGFCAEPNDPDPFRPDNLCAIQVTNGKITGFLNELDEADQQEAYVYAMRARPAPVPPPPTRQVRARFVNPIYTFDPDRIFRAVYADARRVDNDQVERWQELPTRVASEIFKTMLAAERYADLYAPEESRSFPFLNKFQPQFARSVRNQGVLSFQFVRRMDGQPFMVSQDWRENELDIFPVQPLRGSKVLRDRGIRMTTASCSELHPVNDAVREKLLDFWRAKQERDADLKRAPYDYKKIRIATLARVQAQHEIIASLRDILEDTTIPRGAVALRFLQAMQSLAKDPTTERILPQETIQLLDRFQSWFWGNQNQGGNT